jgi:hypothetical protein
LRLSADQQGITPGPLVQFDQVMYISTNSVIQWDPSTFIGTVTARGRSRSFKSQVTLSIAASSSGSIWFGWQYRVQGTSQWVSYGMQGAVQSQNLPSTWGTAPVATAVLKVPINAVYEISVCITQVYPGSTITIILLSSAEIFEL